MNTTTTITFGILCNGSTFQRWQAEAIRLLLKDPRFKLAILIVDKTDYPVPGIGHKLSNNLLYNQYETRILKPVSRQRISLEDELHNVERLECAALRSGKFGQRIDAGTVKHIASFKLDFIVRFGFGILKGDILNAAKWGVWSYHHGDPEQYRGGPPGFWELLHSKPTTGAILQRLTEQLDHGVLLREGTFPTVKHSYSQSIDAFLYGSAAWIKHAALACSFGELDPEKGLRPFNSRGLIYKRPSNPVFLKFLFRMLQNRLTFYRDKYFFRDMWQIGVIRQQPGTLVNGELSPVQWLSQNVPDTFLADPFVHEHNGELNIVLEEYSYKTGKGALSQVKYTTDNQRFDQVRPLLQEATHLSYPFLFSDDKLYLLPESWKSGRLTLYQLENQQLTPVATLLDHAQVIDPTLIKYNDKYWLFCTHKSAPSYQLHIYHSDRITGPYLPHELNPVKTDVHSSRPAGNPFQVNGEWYRPAQNCAETYGGSIVINRITTLSETRFEEHTVNELIPNKNWKFNQGLHTLSYSGDHLVIDAKRSEFNFNLPWKP
ncbi:MAG: hypothetical protein V4616_04265 [Bacteroidota bacterium]